MAIYDLTSRAERGATPEQTVRVINAIPRCQANENELCRLAGVPGWVCSSVLNTNTVAIELWQVEVQSKLDQIAEELRKAEGNLTKASKVLGMRRQQLSKAVNSQPYLQEVMEDIKNGLLDEAESRLAESMRSGHRWAVRMFLLSDMAHERGWREAGQQLNLLIQPAAQRYQLTDNDIDAIDGEYTSEDD